MGDAAEREFMEFAGRFGVTEDKLFHDRLVRVKTGGRTVEELREKVSMATDAMRRVRAETFFDNIRVRARMGQGIHDRLEAYIFADGTFTEYDVEGMNRHVPIPVLFTCARHITVAQNACMDLTADAADWDRGKGDDLFSIFNVKTLVLEAGAKIRVRGNLFVMLCQQLVNHGGSIEVLPTDFSYEKSFTGSMDGMDGQDGNRGCDAEAVPFLQMKSTILGDFYEGDVRGTLHGAQGQDGEDGTDGRRGFCGGALKLAEINIRAITGQTPLSVLVAGGCGGTGGNGGAGGSGGAGASGGCAYRTYREKFAAGNGGDGGNGGAGGNGGRGGNGGISSNVYIEVPRKELVDVTVLPGFGGEGGKPGRGGEPGQGGAAGAVPFPVQGNGIAGADGVRGRDGKEGRRGHDRPAAAVFVCGERLEG